ncbi:MULTISPECIES: AI-2E family transporter [unclassified Haladaptatus]|uniref:AI-2E family transporter n=1 Tax=unclassified Haladaptatus TaxID=2622732 RepID=UPI00209BE3BB|nr:MULTISPECIES: AI-2E family transporter [unclassified Haladaptatus]MCO8246259.1 AI-2E family transporter [Haladaptatus sp. AB643]MCO8255161.1 AI-2E family transporter [Haladaptatus sp. AB618]
MAGSGIDSGATRIRIERPNLRWWVVGLIVFGIVAVVAYTFLPWVVFGLFIYYVARPINRFVGKRIGNGNLSAALSLLLIVVPVVLFLGVFLSIAIGQLANFATTPMVTKLFGGVPNITIPNDPNKLLDTASTTLKNPSVQSALTSAQSFIGAVASSVFMLFLSLLLGFFLLVEDERLARWGKEQLLGDDRLSVDYLEAVDSGLNSIYFGYTLTIFVIMILTALIYNLFNLFAPNNLLIPATILLAVITGIFTLVPLVGRSVVYIAIAAFLALGAIQRNPTDLWYPVVFFLFMTLAFDNVVRTYIRPYLSGKLFHLSLVMFAYLLGPILFGWYGVFLGPLLMVIVVQFFGVVVPQLRGEKPDSPIDIEPTTRETDERFDDTTKGGEATDGGRENGE